MTCYRLVKSIPEIGFRLTIRQRAARSGAVAGVDETRRSILTRGYVEALENCSAIRPSIGKSKRCRQDDAASHNCNRHRIVGRHSKHRASLGPNPRQGLVAAQKRGTPLQGGLVTGRSLSFRTQSGTSSYFKGYSSNNVAQGSIAQKDFTFILLLGWLFPLKHPAESDRVLTRRSASVQ
jgi:hypothetical protein